jgi:hypothetical protein
MAAHYFEELHENRKPGAGCCCLVAALVIVAFVALAVVTIWDLLP